MYEGNHQTRATDTLQRKERKRKKAKLWKRLTVESRSSLRNGGYILLESRLNLKIRRDGY